MNYIIVEGSPIDGFRYVGPFKTHEEALEASDSVLTEWWIANLEELALSEGEHGLRNDR